MGVCDAHPASFVVLTLADNSRFRSGFQVHIYRIDGKVSEGEGTFHHDGTLSAHEGDVMCIDHNGGDLVGTGSTDRTVKVWYGMARVRSLYMVRRHLITLNELISSSKKSQTPIPWSFFWNQISVGVARNTHYYL